LWEQAVKSEFSPARLWRLARILFSGLVAVGLYLLVVSVSLDTFLNWRYLELHGIETTARVLEVEPYKGGRGIKYTFTALNAASGDTKTIVVWERAPTTVAERLKPGDDVSVRYDPANPSNAMVKGYNGLFWLSLSACPGLSLVGLGVWLVVLKLRKRSTF
jgi:hypothetical protein